MLVFFLIQMSPSQRQPQPLSYKRYLPDNNPNDKPTHDLAAGRPVKSRDEVALRKQAILRGTKFPQQW